jgi:hypothetical protein
MHDLVGRCDAARAIRPPSDRLECGDRALVDTVTDIYGSHLDIKRPPHRLGNVQHLHSGA